MFALALGASQTRGADANPPDRLTYQGFVTDANGVAFGLTAPQNYNIIFRIYNTLTGGSPIWSEIQTVTVDKGYYSVLLGEGAANSGEPHNTSLIPFASIFFASDASDRYVEMTVKGIGASSTDVTIKPRLRLFTVPYAFMAKSAQYAASLANSVTNQVVVMSGTNVGINTSSPAAALDVNGGINAKVLTVTGNATLGGTTTAASLNATTLTAGTALVSGVAGAATLNVTNALTAGSATVGGNAAVGGNASVAGTATVAGSANVAGTVNAGAAVVTNTLRASSAIAMGTLTAPSAGIAANGDITFGPTAQRLSTVGTPAASPGVRILYGSVVGMANDYHTTGIGYTVTASDAYYVTFTQPFKAAPTIVVGAFNGSQVLYPFYITSNSFTVAFTSAGVSGSGFHFIAIGPYE